MKRIYRNRRFIGSSRWYGMVGIFTNMWKRVH